MQALQRAVDASKGTMPEAVVEQAAAVHANAGDRLARGDAAVVVALAGGTGSGKSTLFNALAKDDFTAAGIRRPTTTDPSALVVGEVEGADALLDWLEVHKRYVPEASVEMDDGLIVLDLPDHDSIRSDHRATVDRLVQRVDVLVWVVDPQKYAQGLLHRGYLRALRQHADVLIVVLNKIDELERDEEQACQKDLQRILASEGLARVAVLPLSALHGTGIPALRDALSERARARTAAVLRIEADMRKAADDLAAHLGLPPEEALDPGPLVGVVSHAARVEDHTKAAAQRYVQIARRRTRPPLLRLVTGSARLIRRRRRADLADDWRPEAHDPSPVAIRHALHELAVHYGRGLARPWRSRLRQVGLHVSDPLQRLTQDALNRVTAVEPRRRWWPVMAFLWTLAELVVLAGLAWLAAPLVSEQLALPDPVQGFPLPAVAAVLGAVLWVLLLLARNLSVRAGARQHQQVMEHAYREQIAEAVQEAIAPLAVEIKTYQGLVEDLRTVSG